MKASVDPGIHGTGIVVWHEGKPIAYTSPALIGKGADLQERLRDLEAKLCEWWNGNVVPLTLVHGPVTEVTIENVHRWTPKHKLDNVFKTAQAIGILGRFFQVEIAPSATVELLIKTAQQRKTDAFLLAHHFGIKTTSTHLADAVHIGVIAGYDR